MSLAPGSLRVRLLLLILAPLFMVAVLAGIWRYGAAQRTAIEVFDRNLTALTLVVARDLLGSEGDALSIRTRDLLANAGGGQVFYHATGPDRSLLSGYAYPPRNPDPVGAEGIPHLFGGVHRGEPIRAAQLVERISLYGISGPAVVTVWQSTRNRDEFARAQALRAIALLTTLLTAVIAIIWFGVRIGLRPLDDLEAAVALRKPDDLTPIRRQVPEESRALVATLNGLFAQVNESIAARDRFISDAAHQLRNPIAGLRALAESVETAPTAEIAAERARKIAAATAKTSRLINQLLRLERLRTGTHRAAEFQSVDLTALIREAALENAERVMDSGREFQFDAPPEPIRIAGDAVLLREAVENLIDNALTHGGTEMTRIGLGVQRVGDTATIYVEDDGAGIDAQQRDYVFERFAQADGSDGSGLGLAIVDEIIRSHAGRIALAPTDTRGITRFEIVFPCFGS